MIPSGNLGNATACVWARRLGAPIDAHRAGAQRQPHRAGLSRTGRAAAARQAWRRCPRRWTSAIRAIWSACWRSIRTLAALRTALRAVSIDDEATRQRIRIDFERYGRIWCPHSAVAAEAYARLAPTERAHGRWVLVATAHPAKFREIVEPLIGAKRARCRRIWRVCSIGPRAAVRSRPRSSCAE